MKQVLVIDGNSIINRAFYGIRPLSTKDGRPTNAIYGMLNIVLRHLTHINPDYAAVAFDLKAPNFRKQRFSYYKEGRHETPPDLLAQFADAKECLSLLGFHVLEKEGYEADDILGTVARMGSEKEDTHVYVLSGDRDLLQLISPSVTVLLASTGETLSYDRDAFFQKYGIEPTRLVDLKALMGDSSDHILGVAGVGEKTATKLISTFGDLDNLYAHLDDPSIAKGLREKLSQGKESAYDSRWLATICREVPLALSLDDLAYLGVDRERMIEKCADLELFQLQKKLALSHSDRPEPCACPSSTAKTSYSASTAEEILAGIGNRFSLLCQEEGVLLYDGKATFCFQGELSSLSSLFAPSREVIVFDGKRLLHTLFAEGIFPSVDFVPKDIQLYAYLLRAENGKKALSDLAEEEGLSCPPIEALLALEDIYRQRLKEIGSLPFLDETELPLSPVLARMERRGFRIDTALLTAFGKKLFDSSVLYAENIIAMAGVDFNINSPKQLAEVLFTRLGLPTKGIKKTKNGFSTDAEALESLRYAHPIIEEILTYRHLTKLYSTYAVGLCKVADGEGRIHTDFKQALTATGRLSSAEPNLQNIPIRTPLGREMRRCFITKGEDYVLVDADYSQIELRLLAAFSGDEAMCRAFAEGRDIHRQTAAAVFHISEQEVTDEQRKSAKAVNFGIVYGIGAFSLANDLGISVAEAKRYTESYFNQYPAIGTYLEGLVKHAEETGYADTLLGRRRYIPELSSPRFQLRAFGKRVAMNTPLQGSAADIIKKAMVNAERRFIKEGIDGALVMQVHDELIAEVHKRDAERAANILREEMEGAVALSVPLTVSIGIGENWLTAEH
ncbi:MAG: DNA polymerase I [Clostridia bacterium]|nr:DNA polymerase I [Clostridia bacterium]